MPPGDEAGGAVDLREMVEEQLLELGIRHRGQDKAG
jgi:hypothetical protein